jgi:hypothetical protein
MLASPPTRAEPVRQTSGAAADGAAAVYARVLQMVEYIKCKGCGDTLHAPQLCKSCEHTVCGACADVIRTRTSKCPVQMCGLPTHPGDLAPDCGTAAYVSVVRNMHDEIIKNDIIMNAMRCVTSECVRRQLRAEADEEAAADAEDIPATCEVGDHDWDDDIPMNATHPASRPCSSVAEPGDAALPHYSTTGEVQPPAPETAGDAETQPPPLLPQPSAHGPISGDGGADKLPAQAERKIPLMAQETVQTPRVAPQIPAAERINCNSTVDYPMPAQPVLTQATIVERHLQGETNSPVIGMSQEDTFLNAVFSARNSNDGVQISLPTDQVVFLSKLPLALRAKCQNICRAFSLTVVTDVKDNNMPTVVVTSLNDEYSADGSLAGGVKDFSYAVLHQMVRRGAIVGPDWLFQSYDRKMLLPYDKFHAVSNHAVSGPPIFTGVVTILEPGHEAKVRTDISALITAGGGSVVVCDAEFNEVKLVRDGGDCRLRIRLVPDVIAAFSETPLSNLDGWQHDDTLRRVDFSWLSDCIRTGLCPPANDHIFESCGARTVPSQ